MRSDKQLNDLNRSYPLAQLVSVEKMKGREPLMTTLVDFMDKLLAGETSYEAVSMIALHGTPAMMLKLYKAGLLDGSHWSAWKNRMRGLDADLVLETDEEWPHEIREWAAVVTVSGL